eukprot:COSAG02_NODE_21721_length_777_cov_1.445428_1_plen_102_part_00
MCQRVNYAKEVRDAHLTLKICYAMTLVDSVYTSSNSAVHRFAIDEKGSDEVVIFLLLAAEAQACPYQLGYDKREVYIKRGGFRLAVATARGWKHALTDDTH